MVRSCRHEGTDALLLYNPRVRPGQRGGHTCEPRKPVLASPTSRLRMQIRLEPQGREVALAGRRRVGDVIQALGILTGTVMVIRGDELLTDDQFVEDDQRIELRAVISGGAP